jgi:hypothetical protein
MLMGFTSQLMREGIPLHVWRLGGVSRGRGQGLGGGKRGSWQGVMCVFTRPNKSLTMSFKNVMKSKPGKAMRFEVCDVNSG